MVTDQETQPKNQKKSSVQTFHVLCLVTKVQNFIDIVSFLEYKNKSLIGDLGVSGLTCADMYFGLYFWSKKKKKGI